MQQHAMGFVPLAKRFPEQVVNLCCKGKSPVLVNVYGQLVKRELTTCSKTMTNKPSSAPLGQIKGTKAHL